MIRSKTIPLIILIAATLTVVGCSKKEVVNADGTSSTSGHHAQHHSASTSGVHGMDGSGAATDSMRPSTNAIYFAFDSSAIDAAGLAVLDGHAAWLNSHPGSAITIEGNGDERGSREYNLALGQQRADAVRAYLISQGVNGSRIDTVSFGEERPVCTGSGEACWAQNRRADIVAR
ncbi:MAG: peptidoglycan-associated lipoprotein Pal [Mariprofundales bacterium]|nr:peptidoglycan-associated lipoprotein Pal [Mariprofundales bacterium]